MLLFVAFGLLRNVPWTETGTRLLAPRPSKGGAARATGSVLSTERRLELERPVDCPGAGNTTVFLHYRAAGGLVNQLMTHFSAFLLARELRMQVIVAAALSRESYDEDASGMRWRPTRPATLLDVRRAQSEWRSLGIGVYDVIPEFLRSRGGVEGVEIRYADQVEPDRIAVEPRLAVWAPPKRRLPFENVAAQLCKAVAAEVEAREARRIGDAAAGSGGVEDAAAPSPLPAAEGPDPSQEALAPIVLSVGPLLLAFPFRDRAAWTRELVRTLPFAPHLIELADLAVARAEAGGLMPFDGAHLRLERDARPWFAKHGEAWARDRYERAMASVGFDSSTPTYVASGLLTYDSGDNWDLAVRDALGPHSSAVLHKGTLLRESELAAVSTEELAAVDFLILLRARKYVGMSTSSFSFMISEFRTTTGYSPDDSMLVTMPPFGNAIFPKFISFADAVRIEGTRFGPPP